MTDYITSDRGVDTQRPVFRSATGRKLRPVQAIEIAGNKCEAHFRAGVGECSWMGVTHTSPDALTNRGASLLFTRYGRKPEFEITDGDLKASGSSASSSTLCLLRTRIVASLAKASRFGYLRFSEGPSTAHEPGRQAAHIHGKQDRRVQDRENQGNGEPPARGATVSFFALAARGFLFVVGIMTTVVMTIMSRR